MMWTFGCINCVREIPATRSWYERIKDKCLVIIGNHALEFAF